ncbi:MAG: hypothetical protein KGL98_11960 [Gammaproteobacteria bacterium]|nr:hypothetical protein [Gammaproteobacteria bacterium]MBU6510451.1 hypothetical protein [Gammaproteobacteria bacterium]MDE1984013.1 hypothetical protein [Gammaproteobacteria bacterium]MDE2109348.1 hypothetical protein [Gammaproteobacteria bacterium]MDE2461938.1 hypothetical protein [Gammaproteobacteria bacterium]
MKAIVRTCWQICLLRQGPQMFPQSWILFAILLLVYLAIDVVEFVAQGLRGWVLAPELLLDTGMLLAFFALVLLIWQKLERFNQTLSALLGSGSIIMLAAVPISLAATLLPAHSAMVTAAGLLLYGILAWSVLVMGHILRHALHTWFTLGIIIAGTYTLLNLVMFNILFPIRA